MTAPPGDQHAQDERLTKVEEACAFMQHDVEQLSGEVAELARRVAESMRRIEVLERRLAAQGDGEIDASVARPPHAAGPLSDGPRTGTAS